MNLLSEHEEGIAFFMPAHNEAGNLSHVVKEAVSHLSTYGCPFRIIVVNDGSTDDTVDVLNILEGSFPEHLIAVHHPVNLGYGAALRSGFKAGLDTGLAWIGFCDSDGQFKIGCLDKLLQAASQDDADVVLGFRTVRADSLKRKLLGRGWHHVSQAVLGYRARDVDCGFKLFRREVIERLEPRLCGNFAVISPEIITLAQRSGFSIAETGVDHYPREIGEQSGANMRVMAGSILGLLRLRMALRASMRAGVR